MVAIYIPIMIQTSDRAEAKLDPKKWYHVIGTLQRKYKNKEGILEDQDLVIVVNDEGRQTNVFLSKCKIMRADQKSLSGFHANDFIAQ